MAALLFKTQPMKHQIKVYHNPGRLILIRLAAAGLLGLFIAATIVSGAIYFLNWILS